MPSAYYRKYHREVAGQQSSNGYEEDGHSPSQSPKCQVDLNKKAMTFANPLQNGKPQPLQGKGLWPEPKHSSRNQARSCLLKDSQPPQCHPLLQPMSEYAVPDRALLLIPGHQGLAKQCL